MKKAVKLSTKILACFLSVLMLISVVPMTAFATDFKNHQTLNAVETNVEENLAIEKEIVEKRTETSKTYLLEDGTYCELTSTTPVHINVKGEWEDITAIAQPATMYDATVQMKNAQTTANAGTSVDDGYVVTDANQPITLWGITRQGIEVGRATLSSSSTGLLKVNVAHKPIYEKTEVTIKADIRLSCSDAKPTVPQALKVVSLKNAWNVTPESYSAKDFNILLRNIKTSPTIDFNLVDTDARYVWDITSEYIKWENGSTPNNGLAIVTDKQTTSVYGGILRRQYRVIDDNDTGFTYHDIDMGRAGTVYINDYTNVPYLERQELSVNSNLFPVYLSSFINPAVDNNSYAAGGRWNYESKLTKTSDTFIWNMFNNSSTRFHRATPIETDNAGREKWVEYQYNAQGYTLWIDADKTREEDCSNNLIIDTTGDIYHFNYYGYVTAVESGHNSDDGLKINYSGETITSIIDGNGRKYKFTYASLNNQKVITKVGVYKTVGKDKNGLDIDEPIQIVTNKVNAEGKVISKNIEITFETQIINNKVYLTKAIYANDMFVEYGYDSIGRLTSVTDTHGNRLELIYAVKETDAQDNLSPIFTYRVSEYRKYGSDNTLDYRTVLTNKDAYRRTMQKFNTLDSSAKPVFEESLTFNRNLDVLYKTDSTGHAFYADYDSSHNLISLVAPEAGTDNLVYNGDMEIPNFGASYPDGWEANAAESNFKTLSRGEFEDNAYVFFGNGMDKNLILSQTIELPNAKSGEKYVVSSWGLGNATLPKENHFWGIRILARQENGEYKQIHQMPFDASLWETEQCRYTAFSLPFDTSSLIIQLISAEQIGGVAFDDVCLYKADDVYVASVDDATEPVSPNPAQAMDAVNDAHGNPTINGKQTATEMLFSQDKYSLDGQYLRSHTDENKVQTSYEYTVNNGLLKSKTLANNAKIEYDYDAVGALASITQVVTNVLNGSKVKLQTAYAYDDERITSVTHNGFSYNYTYDAYGNISSISMNDQPLVNYTYNNDAERNLGSVTYSNGLTIYYTYDLQGHILSIAYQNSAVPTYEYTYDSYGRISTYTDYVNNTRTSYEKEINGINYIEVMEDLSTNTILYGVSEKQDGSYIKTLFGTNYNIAPYISYDSEGNKFTEQTVETTVFNEAGYIKNYNSRDAFERLKTDAMDVYTKSSLVNGVPNAVLTVKNEYAYKTDQTETSGCNRTTNLVDTFTSSVVLKTIVDGTEQEDTYLTCSYQYDYDAAGRISKIKVPNGANGDTIPVVAYQYDEAGQLVTEVNSLTSLVCSYTYDEGGNRTSVNTHNDAVVDENLNIISLGTPTDTVTYGYDTVWKDKLVNFNGTTIEYDQLGNPKQYIGKDVSGNLVSLDLGWDGRRLSSATTSDGKTRYEYYYNDNDFRTEKITYQKTTYTKQEINSETGEPMNISYDKYVMNNKMKYFWSDDTLEGYQLIHYIEDKDENGNIIFDDNGDPVLSENGTITMTPLYNENKEILGINVISGLNGESSSGSFYFIKDAQGNVISACYGDGNYKVDFVYDAFGNPALDLNGPQIEELNKMIANANGTFEQIIAGIGATLAIAAIVGVTFTCVQNSYRSYLFDAETGLYYCQSRYYAPSWGRFINMDEVEILEVTKEEPLGANLFTYCNNDPVNNVDPDGHLGRHWYNKVSTVAKTIDIAIIAITAGKSIAGQKAMKAFLNANKRKIVKNIIKPICRMIGSIPYVRVQAAVEMGLTLFGTSIGDLIAKGFDYIDPWWHRGYRRNNGYILN